jgi:hypothetical protein
MLLSLVVHTYAIIKGEVQYLFLISGCFFIFAGLFSLTGLVVFIAAINGAVDSKLTLNNSNKDEPVYQYSYGISFYCAVASFLFQELNGICNIYWYMGHYRKIKLEKLRLKGQEEKRSGPVNRSSPEKSSKYKINFKHEVLPTIQDVLVVDESSESAALSTPSKKEKNQVAPPNKKLKKDKNDKYYFREFKRKANLVKNVNIATRRKNSK